MKELTKLYILTSSWKFSIDNNFVSTNLFTIFVKKESMALTSQRGRDIRKEYSEVKEKEVCETRG